MVDETIIESGSGKVQDRFLRKLYLRGIVPNGRVYLAKFAAHTWRADIFTFGGNLELRHLRYFEAVGRNLNFSRAADELHMAQPPLSRQIRQLEEELGADLIDRNSRPLALTKAGTFFLEQCRQIIGRVDEASKGARRIAQGNKRWFGIGFVPSVLYGFLPELIRQFRQSAENVEVVFSELTTVEQVEALKTGRIDVGFGRLVFDDPQLRCEVIEEEPLAVALPQGHPLVRNARISMDRLAEEPFILYPSKPRPSYADHVLQLFRTRGLNLSGYVEANEMQTAIGLVAAGVGIALVPASVKRLRRDDVVYKAVANAGITSPVIMNTRADDVSADLQRFRRLVLAHKRGPHGEVNTPQV
jgi:DNA-binding transcriptional LysR family regulator